MSLGMYYEPQAHPPLGEVFRTHLIDRPGRLLFIGHHLTRRDSVRCLVRQISRQGAVLEVSPFLPVADNFFLVIQGSDDEIGCSLIRREDERVHVAFNMLISNSYLYFLRRLAQYPNR